MSDLSDTIEDAAGKPAEAQNDMGRMKAHPLPDVIEADRYLRENTQANTRRRGLRFTKLVPPGA